LFLFIGNILTLLVSDNFLFATAFRMALRPTQPLIQWVQEKEVKCVGRENDHKPPSRDKVKNAWN
jgi:hypothetical protein